ncbi:MAG: triacylglycerol lipase [Ruminococcus sp.]|nr:triacylglycerol lipase [Ruminococcus sp.]
MIIIEFILLIVFLNVIPLFNFVKFPVVITIAVSVLYLFILFRKEKIPVKNFRLRMIKSGTKLIRLAVSAVIPEAVILCIFLRYINGPILTGASIAFAVVFILVTLIVGMIKTAVGSKQIKITDHIALMFLWWVPVLNFILIRKLVKKARREYIFELDKIELDNARAENEICSTKYPVLLVHGIFFRDWQLLNYWGRIPSALIRNGAEIYYGEQQSALSVPDSAEELKNTILNVIEKTGAEKLNIIAHSKGGLDSRYAISCLGMDKYVATLTTINTPHEGCDMVDYLLDKLPKGMVEFIEKRYNSIFHKLGDKAPDFLAGVYDLSAKKRKEDNKNLPDSPLVSYRSVMSVMNGVFSAGIPLNFGYMLIKKLNGANDGLVWEKSAEHGEFRKIKNNHKRGISHGDVIDLMRENIDGFDVREFYVDIVKNLKEQGY